MTNESFSRSFDDNLLVLSSKPNASFYLRFCYVNSRNSAGIFLTFF